MSTDILNHIQVVSIQCNSHQDALSKMGEVAIQAGYAKPGFIEAILKREAEYPTGLHTPGGDVAIPHADPEWTISPSLTVGFLDQPVKFNPMGGEGGEVITSLILMLTIADASEHLMFLQALAGIMENETTLKELQKTKDVEMLIKELKSKI